MPVPTILSNNNICVKSCQHIVDFIIQPNNYRGKEGRYLDRYETSVDGLDRITCLHRCGSMSKVIISVDEVIVARLGFHKASSTWFAGDVYEPKLFDIIVNASL